MNEEFIVRFMTFMLGIGQLFCNIKIENMDVYYQ